MNKLLEYLGIFMLLGGLAAVVGFAFYADTTVETHNGDRFHNFGLMADRQNGLITGFGFAFLGTAFLFAGHTMTVKKGKTEPSVLNEQGKRQVDWLLSRAKIIASEAASRSKAAAQLTSKQAIRKKIATFDLPNAFAALGRGLYMTGKYREEFASHYQPINKLNNDIAAIEARTNDRLKVDGIVDKAKSAAMAVKDRVQIKALQYRASQCFTALGKLAFETHGEASCSEDLIRPICDAKNRINTLSIESTQFSQCEPGTILTPQRLAIAVGVCVLLILIAVIAKAG